MTSEDDLLPPSYTTRLREIAARGLHVGDPLVDALPLVKCPGLRTSPARFPLEPAPAWADWAKVRRGQAAFMRGCGRNFVALTMALLHGLGIPRFAAVLHHSGYASSADAAFERYRETGFAVIDFMTHALDDPDSLAVQQLRNVRAMHSFARRRAVAARVHPDPASQGVPLSQYDMAEVLLVFSGVAPSVVHREMGVPPLAADDRDALCHTWRLIGRWLGIADEFNPCASLEEMDAMVAEMLALAPARARGCGASALALQDAALTGLGQYTALGVEFQLAMLRATCAARGLSSAHVGRQSVLGMDLLGPFLLRAVGSAPGNWVLTNATLLVRRGWISNPGAQRALLPVLKAASRVFDGLVWPMVGAASWIAAAVLARAWLRAVVAVVVGAAAARRVLTM